MTTTDVDKGDLLRMAAAHSMVAPALKDVELPACAVHVLRHVAGKEPTATEAAVTERLHGARTLRGLTTVTPTDGRVWVRVEPRGTLCRSKRAVAVPSAHATRRPPPSHARTSAQHNRDCCYLLHY